MSSYSSKQNKGFSLIEILVVLSIITIMGGISVFDYVNLRENAILQSSQEGIVSAVRKAQSYAGATRRHDDGTPEGTYDIGYGIHLERGSLDVELFVDVDKSGVFDSGDEVIETITLDDSISFDRVDTKPSQSGIDIIDVVFIRPSTRPQISGSKEGGAVISFEEISIIFESDQGGQNIVEINSSGKVSPDI